MPGLGIERGVAAYLVSNHCSGNLPYEKTDTQETLFAFLVVSRDLRSFLLYPPISMCWWPYNSSCSGVPKALSASGFQFSLQLDVIDCSLLYKSIYWHMSGISFTYRFLFLWAANYNGWGSVRRKIPQIKLYISLLKFPNVGPLSKSSPLMCCVYLSYS